MDKFQQCARYHALEYVMLDSLAASVDEMYEIADAPGQDYATAVACAAVGSALMRATEKLDDEISASVRNYLASN